MLGEMKAVLALKAGCTAVRWQNYVRQKVLQNMQGS